MMRATVYFKGRDWIIIEENERFIAVDDENDTLDLSLLEVDDLEELHAALFTRHVMIEELIDSVESCIARFVVDDEQDVNTKKPTHMDKWGG